MNNIRPVLYMLLAVILFFIWTDWQHRLPPPSTTPSRPVPAVPSVPGMVTTPSPPPQPPAVVPHPAPRPATGGQTVVAHTDTYIATFSTRGADLVRLALRKYRPQHAHSPRLYPLLHATGAGVFLNENGLLGHRHYPNQDSLYQTQASHYVLAAGRHHLRVRFYWQHGTLTVTKTYTFTRGSYLITVRYHIDNEGRRARHVYIYNQFVHGPPPPTHFYHTAPIYIGGAIYTPAHKYQKKPFPAMVRHPLHVAATGGWVAVSQHYFVGAAIPPPTMPTIFYSAVLPGPRYVIGYKSRVPLTVAPHTTTVATTRLFLGPKQPALLRAAAPGLGLTVDYGWLTVLAQPLYWVLAHIEHVTGNWGWAIILLTVLIKLIFFPLSAASFRSMARMRKLQPRMAALKERHGKDRGALQQAMMELYKAEKLNPLGGCLPMVVQIPVFIALYWVLLESVALRDAPFVFWIHNLAAPDPYFVLPILMGVSMMVQQLLNPAMMDPTQRKIMMVMPVIFTGFFLFFPAGLVLYWVTNNVLSIIQQWWVMRRVERG